MQPEARARGGCPRAVRLEGGQGFSDDAVGSVEVGPQEIAEAVSKATGIPVSKLLNSKKIKLSKLQEILSEKIAGQNHAVKSVSETIKRSRTGINDPTNQ